jgi:hypothetical protein
MPMNTSVKFFSSTMLNAPKIAGGKGPVISVLDACLVDGWNLTTVDSLTVSNNVVTANISAGHGFVKWQVIQVAGATPSGLNGEHRVTEVTTNTVKFEVSGVANGTATGTITLKIAPLAWVKAFSGTNKAAYQIDTAKYPQASTCLIRFDDNVSNYCTRLAGFTAMTSVDVGTGQFPTDGQQSSGLWLLKNQDSSTTAYRPWFLVGDGRMFYFGIASYTDTPTYGGPTWAAFGEFQSVTNGDAFDFIVAGNYPNDSTPSPDQSYTFCNASRESYQYLARSYDGISQSARFTSRSWPTSYSGSGEGSAPLAYPNGPNNGLYLCPLEIMETGSYGYHHRGTYPGVLMLPHRLNNRIVPDRQTAVLDDAIAGFEGKVVGFFPTAYSGSERGVVAFDLTGPWEH